MVFVDRRSRRRGSPLRILARARFGATRLAPTRLVWRCERTFEPLEDSRCVGPAGPPAAVVTFVPGLRARRTLRHDPRGSWPGRNRQQPALPMVGRMEALWKRRSPPAHLQTILRFDANPVFRGEGGIWPTPEKPCVLFASRRSPVRSRLAPLPKTPAQRDLLGERARGSLSVFLVRDLVFRAFLAKTRANTAPIARSAGPDSGLRTGAATSLGIRLVSAAAAKRRRR